MSLRYAILGSLAEKPASGYDMVKHFSATLNNVWWASQGAIYTELGKLQREELISIHELGPRGRQTYQLTSAGLNAVRDWLRSDVSRQPRDEMILRVFSLWLLPSDEAADYLDRLAESYQRRLDHYETLVPAGPDELTGRELFDWISLQAGIANETAMRDWARAGADRVRGASRRR